jgi:sugar lactone lactonase YvrE
MGFLSLIKRKPPVRVEAKPSTDGKVVPFVTRRTEITVEREWTEVVVRSEVDGAGTEEPPAEETESTEGKLAVGSAPEIELPHARLQLPKTKFQHRSPVMKSTSLSLCKRALGLLLILALATGAHALGNPTPTIANNTFASVAVGQSQTQTVTLTLTSATAIKSIALATGTAASSEYKLNSVTGCTVDGATVNTSGTVCNLSVTYTPLYAGSLASPRLSRNAQLLYTDASSNVTAYGLSGAATKAIPHVVPGTINLFAGQPYAVSGTAAADNGLGNVTGGYVGNSVAATAATFNFAPYNTILATGVAADGTQPLAYDSQGNLYVIDAPNFIIRKIDNTSQHIITTIAGTQGSQGYTGNGGLATAAKLYNPHAITLDAAGNIYFLDNSGVTGFVYPPQIIRRIDAVTGIITAIAGQNFTGTYDAADGGGTCNLATGFQVPEYECGDGGLATYAYLADTGYLVLDSAGNFYLSSSSGTGLPVVRKITASTGDITTIETPTTLLNTTGAAEGGLTMASDGNLYMVIYDTSVPSYAVVRINPSTLAVTAIASTSATQTPTSCSIAAQQNGLAANTISIATGASQNAPGDLTSDANGNLYVTDLLCTEGVTSFENSIFRINIASDLEFTEVIDRGTQSATALTGYNAYSLYYIQPVASVPDNNGNLYFITYNQIGVLQGTKAALDFGTVTDYQSSTEQTVSYINIGNASSSAPPYSFAGGTNFVLSETGDALACDAQTSLAAGAVCDLDIVFSPVAAGAITDTLNVSSGAETVALTGTGVAQPRSGVAPPNLAFGNQAINTTSAIQYFTITDTGTANLVLSGYFPYVPNNTDYAVVTGAGAGTCATSGAAATLTPGQSCTVGITFTPAGMGALNSTFYLSTNASFGTVATMSGTGVAAGSPAAVLSPMAVAFANTPLNNLIPTSSTIVLSNATGTATLTGITPTITGTNASQFSIDASSTCGTTLATGSTCNIVVDFKPTTLGLLTASLSVADNATGSPQTATLTGIGIRASAGQMQFYPSEMTLFAGQVPGTCSESGIPGPVASANICTPTAVAVDPIGNTYIVDTQYNTVLKVDTSGNVTVFAGKPVNNYNGNAFSGDNGPAASANLSLPADVAVDPAGNVYITDSGNGRIREVNAITGNITTFAGGGAGPYFVPGPATSAAIEPEGINFDAAGNLYIAYSNQNLVIKVTPAGAASVFAGSQGSSGAGLFGYSGDGGPATSAKLDGPNTVAADSQGNVYISDYFNCVIRKVNTSGIITTFAGNGTCGLATNGPALQSQITSRGLATNLAGDLIVSDGTQVVSIQTTGTTNNVTIVGGGGSTVATYPILATSASFPRGTYVARVDNSGNVLIPGQTSTFGYQVVQVGPVGDLQFGSQAVNSSTPMTLTIENTGNGLLQLNGTTVATVTGMNPGDFKLTGSTCGYNLLPGSACVLTVTFTPSTTGPRGATLSVPSGSTTQTVILQGNGAAATPTATLTAINFGNQTQNTTSSAMSATLTNTGTAALTISNIAITGTNLTNFTLSTGTNACGTSLSAGASCLIYVTFSPTSVTTYNATLSVTNNATGSPTTSALSGAGTAPAAPTATLSSIAFGNQAEGTTSGVMYATLSNTSSTSSLTIGAISITGTNAANFAVVSGGTCGSTLAVNISCTIAVTFSPPGVLTGYTATLNVVTNATGSPQTSSLTGNGTYVKPTVTLLPSPYSYGSITIGQKSTAQAFTLTNTGTSPFSFTQALTDSTDFAITGTTCGTTLTAGNSCTVSVLFQPQSAVPLSTYLQLTDSADAVTATATLTGTGTAVPAPVASLTSSIAFPSTAQGATSASMTATLSNTGNATLNIGSIVLGGTNAADFAIVATTNQCVAGGTLGAGSSCFIAATFTPQGTLTYNATITVTDNSATPTQTATLTGTGLAVVADYALASNTPSQTVIGGSAAQYNLLVTSVGGNFSGTVTFTAAGLPPGATVSFNPATVSPGSSSASTIMTIQTVPTLVENIVPSHRPWLPPAAMLAFVLPFLCWRRRKQHGLRLLSVGLLMALLSSASMVLAGCGAGFSLPLGNSTYVITVTAASSTTTHSTTVVLTVQ